MVVPARSYGRTAFLFEEKPPEGQRNYTTMSLGAFQ
jgi:hypothetical protein